LTSLKNRYRVAPFYSQRANFPSYFVLKSYYESDQSRSDLRNNTVVTDEPVG